MYGPVLTNAVSYFVVVLNFLKDLDQVHIILNVVGSPNQEDLDSVTSEQVRFFVVDAKCVTSINYMCFCRLDATFKVFHLDRQFLGVNYTLKQTNKVRVRLGPAR